MDALYIFLEIAAWMFITGTINIFALDNHITEVLSESKSGKHLIAGLLINMIVPILSKPIVKWLLLR